MQNSITFLGTGTSQGIPMIGCTCPVCCSADPRDRRLRTSAYIEYEGLRLIVDAGPDFRQQVLRAGIRHPDAILLTHQHKDHTGGLDDIRAFNYLYREPFPVYAETRVQDSLRQEYAYAFSDPPYPGVPQFALRTIDERPFRIRECEIVPVRAWHCSLPVLGFRFGSLGYLTDANRIGPGELEKFRGVKVFVINTVRRGRHISHFSLEEALEVIRRVGAPQNFLTHLSHQLGPHAELEQVLPPGTAPAYDGLCVRF